MTEIRFEPQHHPAFGLGDDIRITVLRSAVKHGVRYASRKHRVSQASIYRWIRRATTHVKGTRP